MLNFELGLRNYTSIKSIDTKPWNKSIENLYRTNVSGNKVPQLIKPPNYNDKFNGGHNTNINTIRHILNDKKDG